MEPFNLPLLGAQTSESNLADAGQKNRQATATWIFISSYYHKRGSKAEHLHSRSILFSHPPPHEDRIRHEELEICSTSPKLGELRGLKTAASPSKPFFTRQEAACFAGARGDRVVLHASEAAGSGCTVTPKQYLSMDQSTIYPTKEIGVSQSQCKDGGFPWCRILTRR